jgi:hypothetical protein
VSPGQFAAAVIVVLIAVAGGFAANSFANGNAAISAGGTLGAIAVAYIAVLLIARSGRGRPPQR